MKQKLLQYLEIEIQFFGWRRTMTRKESRNILECIRQINFRKNLTVLRIDKPMKS
jgi:hypothetical protein